MLTVARQLGCTASAPIGEGGEAVVYGLDADRVVRVSRHRGRRDLAERKDRLEELRKSGKGPRIPEILEVGVVSDHEYAIERRIPGRPVSEELTKLPRSERSRLIEAHLEASAALGDLNPAPREWFGDLLDPDRASSQAIGSTPIRAGSWHGYLVAKAQRSLAGVAGLEDIDCAELADGMPRVGEPCFVQGDAFVSNMMAEGTTITAVIDIGVTSIVGDRRLDSLTTAVYLCSEKTSPMADETDRRVARAWLTNAGLADFYEPTRRWIAAYWARAIDHDELHQWCRSVLLGR